MIVAFVRQALLDKAKEQEGSEQSKTQNTAQVLYDFNNITISVMFLIYAACFLFYGTKLNCRIGKGAHKKDLIKAQTFSVLLFLCFVVRCVMFSFRIVTNKNIDETVFQIFTYMVPEVLPSLLCLWSINTEMFDEANAPQQIDANSYIDPLIAEEQEDA